MEAAQNTSEPNSDTTETQEALLSKELDKILLEYGFDQGILIVRKEGQMEILHTGHFYETAKMLKAVLDQYQDRIFGEVFSPGPSQRRS